jgi:hypothetical protein
MATYEYDAVRTFNIEGHAVGNPTVTIYVDGAQVSNNTLSGNLSEIATDLNPTDATIQLGSWTHDYTGNEDGQTFAVRVEVTGGSIVWRGEKCNRTYEGPTNFGWVLDFTNPSNAVGCKSNIIVDGETLSVDRATTAGNVSFQINAGETATFTMTTPDINRGPNLD